LEEIWNGQELLLANREYPMEGEATAREDISEVIEDGMEDEGALGADKKSLEVISTRPVTTQADGECTNHCTRGQMEPSSSSTLLRRSATYRVGRTLRRNIRTSRYPLLKPQRYVRTCG